MGLTNDIENALFKSMGEPEDKGNLPQLAVDIADAVINFLTKQTFTITEMKSILEVEEISTTGPLQGDVLTTVTTAAGGNVVMGKMKDYLFSEIENTLHDLSIGAIDSTVCYERLRNLGLSEEDIPNWMDIEYVNH